MSREQQLREEWHNHRMATGWSNMGDDEVCDFWLVLLKQEREKMMKFLADEEKLLKISKNTGEDVIMNLRTRLSNLTSNE